MGFFASLSKGWSFMKAAFRMAVEVEKAGAAAKAPGPLGVALGHPQPQVMAA